MLKLGPFPSLDVTSNGIDEYDYGYDEEDIIQVWDEKGRNKIAQIFISCNDEYIKSLAFQYFDESDGSLKLSPIFGCQSLDGSTFETVMFKKARDNEYITRVSGSYEGLLKSLKFETNVATYGPFGIVDKNNSHQKFQIDLGHGDQFGGFHGKSSTSFIASIGVYLKPIQDLDALSKKNHVDLSQLSIH